MSKLETTPRINTKDEPLLRILRDTALTVNAIAEGRQGASYNALPAAPAVTGYAQGDFVRNSAPAEAGTAGSKYVVYGWQLVSQGGSLVFVPVRYLTGN